MAEKRKLPARERREPAAKRRISEGAPQTPSQPQSSSRKKASTPGNASNAASTPSVLPPEPPVDVTPLPTKVKDGEGLPTVATPQQAFTLSDKEYQSIAESAVLLASLERSKRKWLSDGILVRYWTKPKKTKRDQIEGKNPPKESMSKVGPCAIMVGPHLFDAMLYTVKDPNAPPPIQYTPPQRPMVHYGHPNNFQQYHPYPHPPPPLPHTMPHTMPPHQQPQSVRQPPPPAHPGPPQPGYHSKNHNQPMRPPPQHGRASGQASPNPPHPPPPGQQQRPSPSQPAQPQPPKPSPDPVIQMLATRAASDPELKALMRVVASTEATQEQLRAFQSHIDELNAIIRAREQRQQQRQQPAAPPPPPQNPPQQPSSQQKPPEPQSNPAEARSQSQPQPQQLPRVEVQIPRHSPSGNPPQTPSQQPASQAQTPSTTPQVKQEPNAATPSQAPAATPSGPNVSITPGPPPTPAPHSNSKQPSPAVRPMPQPPPPQSAGPRPGPPYPPYQQPPYQGQPPPIHSRPPQYGSPVPYYRPAPPPPPPRLNYKSVVLEFTSPLTPYGSSTSGHAGSGDRYLFPENTILEWLPGGTTVLASFLLVRKVDPNAPFPIETASDLANSRAKGKSSKSKKKKTADEKEDEKAKEKGNQPAPSPSNPEPSSNAAPGTKPAAPTEGDKPSNTQDDKKDQPASTPDTKSEPAKENPEDTKTKEPNLKEYYQPITFRIQAPNPKVLEPLARVVKPPGEVRKYMDEVMDRAERAPDGFLAYRLPREEAQQDEKRENEEHGKKSGTGTPVPALNTTARNRPSRGNKTAVEQEDVVDTDVEAGVEDVEEEEELKDFYGPPTGIGFW